jgi:hypothetical protein
MELPEMVLHQFGEVLMSLHKIIIILKLTNLQQLRAYPGTLVTKKVR